MPRPNHSSKSSSGSLHPRNLHQGRYDLDALCRSLPELKKYITRNPSGQKTINFEDPISVMCLNQALLAHYYKVTLWQIPKGYLCPPIPGRADYIHYLADLLAESNNGLIPKGKNTKVLDVGCGANCIYPIIGSQSYGWQFVGSDIDPVSVQCAQNIVKSNTALTKQVKVVQQMNADAIFEGVIKPDDHFSLTMCNPPFHASLAEAQAASQRKQKNLQRNQSKRGRPAQANHPEKPKKSALNFGGQQAELWCPGGELKFLKRMIKESVHYSEQVSWFSSLVSKAANVSPLRKKLKELGCMNIKIVKMTQGQKTSRFIAWQF